MTLKQLVWNKFSYKSMENLSDYQVFCLEFQLSANMKHSVWIDFSVCIQLYFQNKLIKVNILLGINSLIVLGILLGISSVITLSIIFERNSLTVLRLYLVWNKLSDKSKYLIWNKLSYKSIYYQCYLLYICLFSVISGINNFIQVLLETSC